MTDVREVKLIEKTAEVFCFGFLKELNSLKDAFNKFNMNLTSSLPKVFKDGNLDIRFIYSTERDNLVIIFNKLGDMYQKDQSRLCIQHVNENVFDVVGGGIDYNSQNVIIIEQCSFNGYSIDYAMAIPFEELVKREHNIKQYTSDFASLYWAKFLANNDKNSVLTYNSYVKNEMKTLFYDKEVGELEIDKFIEENPIILERGLCLIFPMHQVVLKNILGKYEHDLKPDLIAYDTNDRVWAIVDYKRAKKNIIKNVGKVRTGFKAEVHALKDQLRDYTEYFDEKDQREYVKNKYNKEITHPKAIGIIGSVESDKEEDFNRLIRDEPRWFNIVPYNYLYDRFCRYSDIVEMEFKG